MIIYSKNPAACSSSTFIERYHKEVLSKAKAHTFPYRRYSQEEINLLNSVNTIEVCVFISASGLSYQAGRLLVRNHPHVIVYPEGFYDTQSGKCYNTINGLSIFFGFSFPEACYIIKRYLEGDVIFHMDTYIKARYPLAYDSCLAFDFNLNYMLKDNLLVRSDNNSLAMVFSVLFNRMCIDRKTIQKFLHSKKLIVNRRFDLCFLEYEDGNVIAATKKFQSNNHLATELSTVKRNTTFTWVDEEASSYYNVYIFEDVYQIMSYLTLINKGLVPELEPNSIMLSLGGMSFDALKSYLNAHKEVKAVYACLSNTMLSIDTLKDIPFDAEKVINMQPYLKEYTAKHELVETWSDMLKLHTKNEKE